MTISECFMLSNKSLRTYSCKTNLKKFHLYSTCKNESKTLFHYLILTLSNIWNTNIPPCNFGNPYATSEQLKKKIPILKKQWLNKHKRKKGLQTKS